MPLVALAAQIGGFFLQKILERFDPGQQTEVLKAALNLLEGRLHSVTLLASPNQALPAKPFRAYSSSRALLLFVDSAPRAYRLRGAAPNSDLQHQAGTVSTMQASTLSVRK